MNVVGQSRGAGTEHQHFAEFCIVMQHRSKLFQGRLVFAIPPGPVTMHIGIVGIQALIDWQARAHRQVGFVIGAAGLHVQWLHQLLQVTPVLFDGGLVALQSPFGKPTQVLVLEFCIETGGLVA